MSKHVSVLNLRSDRIIATFARVAETFDERRAGLLFGLGESDGLLIPECWAIHTVGMKFPIDVVFFDEQGRVVLIEPNVMPGRQVFWLPGIPSVLELPCDVSASLALGDLLQITPAGHQ
jgi:uncharacterized protein